MMAARGYEVATASKRSVNDPLTPKWRIAQARRTDEWRMRRPLQSERDPFGQHYGTRMGAINHALSTEARTVLEIAEEAGLDGADKAVLNGVRSHLQWLKRQGYVQGRGRGLWSLTAEGAKLMRKTSGSTNAAAEESIRSQVLILTAKDRVYRAFLDNPEITFNEAKRHAPDKSDVTVRNWLHRAKQDYSALRLWQEAHSSSNELRSHVPVNTRDLWNEAIAKTRADDSRPNLFFAKVRDLSKPYADGTPNLEINLRKEEAAGLPFRIDDRVSVRLRVAGLEYDAGLRSTARHVDVWVSPDLYTSGGERFTLGRVLTDAGFEANDTIRLLFDGRMIEVQTIDGRPSKDTAEQSIAENLEAEKYFEATSEKDERERRLRESRATEGAARIPEKASRRIQRTCAITGCDAVDALEACHVQLYLGADWNHVSNGLLLRADMHTLFDLDLIGIHPRSLRIALAPRLRSGSYSEVEGIRLAAPDDSRFRPNRRALQKRWDDSAKRTGFPQ